MNKDFFFPCYSLHMIFFKPTGREEVGSDRLLVAAEELQSAGQLGLQPVQPGNLLQPGTVPVRLFWGVCSKVVGKHMWLGQYVQFWTWSVVKWPSARTLNRSKSTFTLATTQLPMKRSVWRSSAACAAASASRLTCASCSMRWEVSFIFVRCLI